MCFFISLFPATFWVIVGYFILFSSTKVDGPVKTFGRGLATWAFAISGLVLSAGAYVTLTGLCSIDALMQCSS